MAIPIFKNQIQQIINQKAEDNFSEWIRQDIQEIEGLKRRFQSGQKNTSRELNQLLPEIQTLFSLISHSQTRPEALAQISKLNSKLTDLQKVENSFLAMSKSVQRALRSRCQELAEYIHDYEPDLDEGEIYREILNSPGFQVTLPGAGPTLINPREMERRFDIRKFIREQISNIVIYEKDEMINTCEELDQTPFPDFRMTLQPMAIDLVNHLSALGLSQTPEINRLATNLKEVLKLEFEVEVSQPETSQDALLAEVISLCDQPRLSHRLIQVGAELGYPEEQLTKMAYPDLCNFLRRHFNL